MTVKQIIFFAKKSMTLGLNGSLHKKNNAIQKQVNIKLLQGRYGKVKSSPNNKVSMYPQGI